MADTIYHYLVDMSGRPIATYDGDAVPRRGEEVVVCTYDNDGRETRHIYEVFAVKWEYILNYTRMRRVFITLAPRATPAAAVR